MNLPSTFAIAIASLTVAAYAEPGTRVMIRHGMAELNMDADNDGWISRAEASAAADRLFDRLDSNNDGQLTRDDRPEREEFDVLVGPGPHGHGPRLMHGDNCTTSVEEGPQQESGDDRRIERRITVICENESGGERRESDSREERREERRVIIRRADDHAHEGGHRHGDEGAAHAPAPPIPPIPPHPPMFVMMHGGADESDLNNDGSLSREEFRAQHLRFFDASDANRDGRVRFTPPPQPPAPPQPPQAPRAR